ncbi:MAG: hypothetical protein AAB638_01410, partial [Patescibacteria group bacterium]
MTGRDLVRKIQEPPFPTLAHQLIGDKMSTQGFYSFLEAAKVKIGCGDLANQEVLLEQLPKIFEGYPFAKLMCWTASITEALRKLGRYDWSDDIKWNGELGSCSGCERLAENNTTDQRRIFICGRCHRRFWRHEFIRWKQVLTPAELDRLRAPILAGLAEELGPRERKVDDSGICQM